MGPTAGDESTSSLVLALQTMPAVVVVDADVSAVGVVRPEREPRRRRATDGEVVRPRAVEVAGRRSGEHAVGGELGPAAGRRAARRVEAVGHLAERASLDQRSPVGDRERRLHTAVGCGVGRRVRDHLVPELRPVRRVGVIPAVDRCGGIPRAEVQVAVAVDRGGRVDRLASRDLNAVDARARGSRFRTDCSGSPDPSQRCCPFPIPIPERRIRPAGSARRDCPAGRRPPPPGVPLSLNATGEASTAPHGASLRTSPGCGPVGFHVSVSVSCAGAPATLVGEIVPRAMHAPVATIPARMHRVAIARACVTVPRICRPSGRN